MNSIFQSAEWEKFKLESGYSKSYRIEDILVLQKDLPFGRTMLYSPMVGKQQLAGRMENREWRIEFLENIGKIASENKSIFYRLEIDSLITDQLINKLTDQQFIKSFEEMQPEHTLILDISQTDEEILKQMKPKGRYNIKVAQKHHLKVTKTRDVNKFYQLYEETAKRQRITYRNSQYFQKLLDILEPKGYCEIFNAYIDKCQINSKFEIKKSQTLNDQPINQLTNQRINKDIVLASAVVIFYKGRATYLFGASSNEMRNVMAPYVLHWEIIKEAKKRRCVQYDFFGIAPPDKPKHRWAGVTKFKKQFGGKEIAKMGSFDKVYKPIEYQIFKIAERLRR